VLAVLVFALLLQATVASDLRVDGTAPDFLLLVAVAAGLTAGARHGMLVGFAAGLLSDLYVTGTPVGLSALSLCLVGYAVGSLREAVLPDSRLLVPAMALVATGAAVVLYLVVGDLVGQSQLIAVGRSVLVRTAVVESLWSAVLAIPACALYRRAARGTRGVAALDGRSDALA
jgi:rod shape-determining protein MreD